MGSRIYRKKRQAYLFLLPALLFIGVFLFYPFVQNIINSMQDIEALGTSSNGWKKPLYANYAAMLTDPHMRTALINTGILMLVTVFGQVGIALVLALLTDRIHRGVKFFRTVYFFPVVISATALGLLFKLIFLYDNGMLNQLLTLLGRKEPINWREEYTLLTMMLPVMWQYVGFYYVIFLTGLSNIPTELYEAAELDGVGGWSRIRYITLPMLRNVICTCVLLSITGTLKVFDLPWIMFPKGMPLGRTWLTGTYMYYRTLEVNNAGYGSAIAVVIVVIGVAVSLIMNAVCRRKSED